MSDRSTSDRYESLFEHCVSITSSLDTRTVALATIAALRDILGDATTHLFEVSDDRALLLSSWPEMPKRGRACDNEILLHVLSDGRPEYLTDLEVEGDNQDTVWPLSGALSVFIVPVQASGRSVGLLTASSPKRDAFTNTQRVTVLSLAPAIGSGLHLAGSVAAERTTWQRQRELDGDKSLFIWLAAEELLDPLSESRALTNRLSKAAPEELTQQGRELEAAARDLALHVEDVLSLAASETWTARNIERVELNDALRDVGVGTNALSMTVLADPGRFPRVARYLIGDSSEVEVRRDGDQAVVSLPGRPKDQRLVDALARSIGAEATSPSELTFEVVS